MLDDESVSTFSNQHFSFLFNFFTLDKLNYILHTQTELLHILKELNYFTPIYFVFFYIVVICAMLCVTMKLNELYSMEACFHHRIKHFKQ